MVACRLHRCPQTVGCLLVALHFVQAEWVVAKKAGKKDVVRADPVAFIMAFNVGVFMSCVHAP